MSTSDTVSPPAIAAKDQSGVSYWYARIWQGMTLPIWLRLLAQHPFRIDRPRIKLAARMTLFATVNSLLAGMEQITHGERIKSARVQPPLFVIGHWRTGTTWLHELLALDERFTCPTTYQCSAPHHFLITQSWLPRLLWYMMPERRPMDNMAAGWDRPQEDEFALCNLGLPSPYLDWAFPNDPHNNLVALDLHTLPRREQQRWQRGLRRFLEHLACHDPRRPVLKSPTHTARVGLLRGLFPGAQFVHIVRDPFVVFSSTVNLWKRLWNIMGMQEPHYRDLENYVFECFTRMYQRFNDDRKQLGEYELCEVRYEDLRADVIGEMGRVYDQLGLGEFERVKPKLQGYVEQTKDYRTNRFDLDETLRRDIVSRWADYFKRYDYQ